MRGFVVKKMESCDLVKAAEKLTEAQHALEELFDAGVIGASRYALTAAEIRHTTVMVHDRLRELEEAE